MCFSNTFVQQQACWVVYKLLMKRWQILGFYGLENSANQRALLAVHSIFSPESNNIYLTFSILYFALHIFTFSFADKFSQETILAEIEL